ncbi:electroneutral sodium bicarbonate exchanger 1-like isoform X2 [Actinia tenebrosa]|uniref:Anion exchange protein n=1 Tax=Actinia tenebrosa TaxID=6105 RepID=A0A6P8IY91_ACTTE|nr:electroneutral sodium bicarbonate exchanger 1-like isoform X2 [Actinia tenebrosa]
MADEKRFSMGEEGTLLDKAITESANHYFDELDYRNHRQVYVGVHLPIQNASSRTRRTSKDSSRRRHHHRHRRKHKGEKGSDASDIENPCSLPNERVRFILGGQEIEVEGHQIFAELDEYRVTEEGGVWKESARWLKFEEDVEEVGDRWSKPHVATLSLYSLFELRSCLLHGSVLLDLNASNLEQIWDLVLDDLVYTKQLEQDNRAKAKEVLLEKHVHQFDKSSKSRKQKPKTSQSLGQQLASLGSRKSSAPSLQGLEKKKPVIEGSRSVPFNLTALMEEDEPSDSDKSFPYIPSAVSLVGQGNEEDKDSERDTNNDTYETFDHNFMKKIPPGAEASNSLVGEVDFLKKPIIAFIRLENSLLLNDITEVPIPTRFMFIMLGPPSTPGRYHEVGRAIATLMSDEIFHEVAYKANCRQDLLSGMDEFLMQGTVLPPGEWDPSIRIEPPATVPSQEKRLKWGELNDDEDHDPADREEHLRKTGRLFGGLLADLRRRLPWYCSDFKDALSPQCIASVIFIYFACLTPIITFGGLMSTKTDHYMGAVEQMLAGSIGGILFSLFGGQPLIILGATGPMLVFEEIIYSFCQMSDLEYLPFRMWIGIWTMLFCFILVFTDASSYVCYFTRFTEECFATLIALIFIVEGFSKLWNVQTDHPIDIGYTTHHECLCKKQTTFFGSVTLPNGTVMNNSVTNWTELNVPIQDCEYNGGKLIGMACDENVFFLSVILTFGTFAMAISLKSFRSSTFFPTKVRAVISDFAVLISILVFVSIDVAFGVNTPKLIIPLKFQPTASHKRGWLIPPLGKNPAWVIVAAAIPAVLATILVFMDQQITALIVNRREHKLKKGAGYHLDLLMVAIIIGICSVLGLPWVVAATVLSVSHVQSLFLESQCTAPGEKTKFLGVREQRITGTAIFILIGLSVLMTPILKYIPMPVLYGLFLYMGFSALKGIQFFERIKIMFMPAKHQPDLIYLRRIKITRVHLFTFIQITCLVVLWAIKSTPAALVFPIMVLMLVVVRKVMEKFFSKHELQVLDDLMPETVKKKKLVASMSEGLNGEAVDGDGDGDGDGSESGQEDDVDGEKKEPQVNGPTQVEIPINISDEMTKSSLWKSFVREGSVKKRDKSSNNHHSSRNKHRHRHKDDGKHRSKHSRNKDKDPGLWFSMDKRRYDENDTVELRRLTAIEEDEPVVDPKEFLEIPEVRVTMPSSNGINETKDKEA